MDAVLQNLTGTVHVEKSHAEKQSVPLKIRDDLYGQPGSQKNFYSLIPVSVTSFFSLITHSKDCDLISTVRGRYFRQKGS